MAMVVVAGARRRRQSIASGKTEERSNTCPIFMPPWISRHRRCSTKCPPSARYRRSPHFGTGDVLSARTAMPIEVKRRRVGGITMLRMLRMLRRIARERTAYSGEYRPKSCAARGNTRYAARGPRPACSRDFFREPITLRPRHYCCP